MGRRKRKSEQVIKELWQAKGPSVEPSCLYQLIVGSFGSLAERY